MVVLIFLLVAYSLIGGIAYSKVTGVSMIEGIYFSTITIFTIGYGDIRYLYCSWIFSKSIIFSPAVPVYVVIVFIVFGVALVTIASELVSQFFPNSDCFSVDVVAANIIHHIHYMGRQVGKARIIADKMLSVRNRLGTKSQIFTSDISINLSLESFNQLNCNINQIIFHLSA